MAPTYQMFYDNLENKYNKIQNLKEEFKEIQQEFGIKKASTVSKGVSRFIKIEKPVNNNKDIIEQVTVNPV